MTNYDEGYRDGEEMAQQRIAGLEAEAEEQQKVIDKLKSLLPANVALFRNEKGVISFVYDEKGRK